MSGQNPINLHWTFGINTANGMTHLLSSRASQKVFFFNQFILYSSAQVVVIADIQNKKQKQLQGHVNSISSLAVTKDRRWFASCDQGEDSIIIIWENICCRPENLNLSDQDAFMGAFPIKNIYNPHQGAGVLYSHFTADSKYLITIGADSPQSICVWDWTTNTSSPKYQLKMDNEVQRTIACNPNDSTELMTIGRNSAYFYTISEDGIEQHQPEVVPKEFHSLSAEFLSCSFSSLEGEAVVGNKNGELIIFSNSTLSNLSTKLPKGKKGVIKSFKLYPTAITYINVYQEKFMVIGGADGILKIYDLNFRVVFWFDSLNAGAITNILCSPFNQTVFEDSNIPEMFIATEKSSIFGITAQSRSSSSLSWARQSARSRSQFPESHSSSEKQFDMPNAKLYLQGTHGTITALAIHSPDSKMVVGTENGLLQLWNYQLKTIITIRNFQKIVSKEGVKAKDEVIEPHRISNATFSKSGGVIAVGFADGELNFLDSTSLMEIDGSTDTQISNSAIKKISFSEDGFLCAAVDSNNVTILFRKMTIQVNQPQQADSGEVKIDDELKLKKKIKWVYVGRYRAHYKEVVALLFTPSNPPKLFSVSKDRHIAEYDISGIESGKPFGILSIRRVEQIYSPESAILFQETTKRGTEALILAFNSGLKFRTFIADTQLCRQTSLGPTFGSTLHTMELITIADNNNYVAFATDNVIGLAKLPLDGNPYRYCGVIAHPKSAPFLVVSKSGNQIISAGETPGSVNMWNIYPKCLDMQVAAGGDGMSQFLRMLDPPNQENESPNFKEFEDYFYYAMIKAAGEKIGTTRTTSDTVPLDQIAPLCQAMGYYPSYQDIDDMINEIKFSKLEESEGEVSQITLNELIKLYLNHRPVIPISTDEIEIALSHAKRLEPGMPSPLGPVSKMGLNSLLKEEGLMALIGQFGESIDSKEAEKLFNDLIFEKEPYFGKFPSKFTPKEFIDQILGFSVDQ